MPRPDATFKRNRGTERGNIVLITALVVVALGTASFVLARLVQQRLDVSTEMRLSNYAGTLAVNVAESGLNRLLYSWNTGGPVGTAPAAVPYSVTTRYPGFTADVVSNCSYVTTVTGGGPYTVTVVATVNTPTFPRPEWRTVVRSATASIDNSLGYWAARRYWR